MSNLPFIHLTNGYEKNEAVKLRLAILGAPGSGKSTLAAGLLYFCKLFSFKVDAVPEVAKWHFYRGSDFRSPNFEYKKFEEQLDLENIYPPELDILICEAPLTISAVYSAYYNGNDSSVTQTLMDAAVAERKRYTHYIVTRKLTRFETFGRHQTESESDEIHLKTLEILEKLQLNYVLINEYDEHMPIQLLSMLGAIRPAIATQISKPEQPSLLS